MKCNEAEKSILLQDSGELAVRQSGALETHLHECASCRRFQQILEESGRIYSEEEEPDIRTMQNILREARRNAPQRKPFRLFGWKPALAMASTAVIAVGLFLSNVSPDRVGMVFTVTETQLLEPDDQIVSVMYEGLSEDDLAFNFLMTFADNG